MEEKTGGSSYLAVPARAGAWVDFVQNKPYIQNLLPSWLSHMEAQANTARWLCHQQAMDLYVEAQADDAADRRRKLDQACDLLRRRLESKPDICAGQTFLRIASELAETEDVLPILQDLIEHVMAGNVVDLSEPFLPVLSGYERFDPAGDPARWVLAVLLELRDRLLAGRTEYDNGDAAAVLELIDGLGFCSDYVDGRRAALRARPVALEGVEIIEALERECAPEQRPVRVLHNLARSGGTLMSRCLGCMQDIVLLSEIHPKGGTRFHPMKQAQDWFHLFDAERMREMRQGGRMNFVREIDLIEQRCRELGRHLVVRDWAHLDFHAVPFTQEPTCEFTTANVLGFSGLFRLHRAALTRHPVDQWISLSRLSLVRKLSLEDFLRGYLRYAEQCVNIGFVRYEDFVVRP